MYKPNYYIKNIVLSALLTALGIVIPMFMPKLQFDVFASYTLASHLPLFIAVFISPLTALIVGAGTSIGFFITLPPVVGFRALSHIIWAVGGAWLIQRDEKILKSMPKTITFGVIISVIHSILESIVVYIMMPNFRTAGILMLVYGLGYVAHSLVDFALAVIVYKSLKKARLA